MSTVGQRRKPTSPGGATPDKNLRDYLNKHDVEPLLVQALKSAVDADAPDPNKHIADFMMARAKQPDGEGSSSYMSLGAIGVARERTAWLLFFLCGLLLCANVMHSFEEVLANELELAFFVPLLIGHGGNSGGQVVSTVIRALGSGSAKLSDAPRVILKEATAGVLQSVILVCFLAPALHLLMGISFDVTCIVGLSLPCLGLLANTLGASLPFVITYLGRDPAVIVGPLMTTSVDSLGLMSYLLIATTFLSMVRSGPACHVKGFGCVPSNAFTGSCKKVAGACVGMPL